MTWTKHSLVILLFSSLSLRATPICNIVFSPFRGEQQNVNNTLFILTSKKSQTKSNFAQNNQQCRSFFSSNHPTSPPQSTAGPSPPSSPLPSLSTFPPHSVASISDPNSRFLSVPISPTLLFANLVESFWFAPSIRRRRRGRRRRPEMDRRRRKRRTVRTNLAPTLGLAVREWENPARSIRAASSDSRSPAHGRALWWSFECWSLSLGSEFERAVFSPWNCVARFPSLKFCAHQISIS